MNQQLAKNVPGWEIWLAMAHFFHREM